MATQQNIFDSGRLFEDGLEEWYHGIQSLINEAGEDVKRKF